MFARDPGLPQEPILTPNRVAAAVVSLGTLLAAYLVADGEMAAYCLLNAFIANLMIWFPSEIGRYSGYGLFGMPPINRPTPEILVTIGGWFLLMFPIGLSALVAWLVKDAV